MKMNLSFSLDVQEKSRQTEFLKAFEEVVQANIGTIDVVGTASLNNDEMLLFMDGSKCRFEGHNIVLID